MEETAEKFKNEYDLDLFMEAFTKTGMNAQELFTEGAKLLFKDYNKYQVVKKKSGDTLKKNIIKKRMEDAAFY